MEDSVTIKRATSQNYIEHHKGDGGMEAQDPWYVSLAEPIDSKNWMHLLALMEFPIKIGVLHHLVESKSSETGLI